MIGGFIWGITTNESLLIIAYRILSNVGLRMFNANLHPDIVYRFTRFYRKEMESRKFCYAFTDKVMCPNILKLY